MRGQGGMGFDSDGFDELHGYSIGFLFHYSLLDISIIYIATMEYGVMLYRNLQVQVTPPCPAIIHNVKAAMSITCMFKRKIQDAYRNIRN